MSSIQLELPFPPDEQWKDIPGWEGLYQVSSAGLFRRLTSPKPDYPVLSLVAVNIAPNGYARVRLFKGVSRKYVYVHRLVMLAFKGVCPEGMQVNHIDGNKINNHLNNLEYVTPQQNITHAQTVLGTHQGRKGLQVRGFKVVLNETKVREIRALSAQSTTHTQIARLYHVSIAAISLIVHRKNWKHVD